MLPRSLGSRPLRAGAVALSVTLSLPSLTLADEVEGVRPPCVSVRAQAVHNGNGFNHLVYVRNGCVRPVVCRVTTDVNPQPTTVTVAPDREEMVNTFLDSPVTGFRPRVECQYAP